MTLSTERGGVPVSPSPTRITTAEELEAFESGTVVRDRDGRIWEKEQDPSGAGLDWMCMQSTFFREGRYLVLPADVLWPLPAAPSVSDTAAATITPEQFTDAMTGMQFYANDWARFTNGLGRLPDLEEAMRAVLAALGLTVTERSEVLTDKADQ